jgi:phage-related protein
MSSLREKTKRIVWLEGKSPRHGTYWGQAVVWCEPYHWENLRKVSAVNRDAKKRGEVLYALPPAFVSKYVFTGYLNQREH